VESTGRQSGCRGRNALLIFSPSPYVALQQRRPAHCAPGATPPFIGIFTEPMNRCSNTMTALRGGCAAARQPLTLRTSPGSVVNQGNMACCATSSMRSRTCATLPSPSRERPLWSPPFRPRPIPSALPTLAKFRASRSSARPAAGGLRLMVPTPAVTPQDRFGPCLPRHAHDALGPCRNRQQGGR
jgi:hypothetical protein